MRKFLLGTHSRVYLFMSVSPKLVSSKINSASFSSMAAGKQPCFKGIKFNPTVHGAQHDLASSLDAVSLEAVRTQLSRTTDESSMARIPGPVQSFIVPYFKLVQSVNDLFYCMNSLFTSNAGLLKSQSLPERLRNIADSSKCDLKTLTDDLINELTASFKGDPSIISLEDSDSAGESDKLPTSRTEASSSKANKRRAGSPENNIEFDDSDIDLELADVEDQLSGVENSKKRKKDDDEKNKEMLRNLKFERDGFLAVYIDGSCWGNGRSNAKAGLGVWFNDSHPLNVSKPVKGPPTNNNAEIQAATEAILQAKSVGIRNLRIYTDSMFLINCITVWIRNWKRNGWKTASKENVKNKNSLMELDKVLPLMQHIDWKHVDGHTGIWGNERADQLAKAGAERYRMS